MNVQHRQNFTFAIKNELTSNIYSLWYLGAPKVQWLYNWYFLEDFLKVDDLGWLLLNVIDK